jgi:hypothetical protein
METSLLENTTPGVAATCRASGHRLSFLRSSLGFFLPLLHFRIHVFALFHISLASSATAAFPQTLPEQCSTCLPSQFTTLSLLAQYTNHTVRLSLHLFFPLDWLFLDVPQNGFSHRRNLADNIFGGKGGGGDNRPWMLGTSVYNGVKLER